jgi:hypothetical protein
MTDEDGATAQTPRRIRPNVKSRILRRSSKRSGDRSASIVTLQVLHLRLRPRKQVTKLAVYEAPYSLDSHARKAAKEYYVALKEALSSGHNGDAVALFVRSVGVSDKQIHAMRKMPMWKGLEKLAPTLVYDSEVLGEGHSLPSALLSRVRTPTLVMHGGAGSPQMREAARAISEAIPGAELRSLARQTHGVSPRVIAPVLEEFFA